MSDWLRLEPGMQLGTFGHPVYYGDFQITSQREFDVLLTMTEVLAEKGATDEQIVIACTSFLRHRRMN